MTDPAPPPFRSRLLPGICAFTLAFASACNASDPDPGADGGVDAPADALMADARGTDDGAGTVDGAGSVDGSAPADATADVNVEPIARLIVLGRDGHAASLELAAPFPVRATTKLGGEVASAKCRGRLCVVVHAAPVHTVDLVDAATLVVKTTFTLAGADPRDATWLDDRTVLVTQYERAELVVIDVMSRATTPIALAALADEDGIPEAGHVANCGRTAYVQLARKDHETGAPSTLGAVIAVVDLDRAAGSRIVDVDPGTDGVQGVALTSAGDFDMPVDCAAARLFVAEPKPLFSGGGRYEVVDLSAFTASEYQPLSSGAQVGGFVIVDDTLGWRITHTEFGPGSSSHLELVGAGPFDTHNTFSSDHVDDLAIDRAGDLLFFPDPCRITPSNLSCQTGVHVFRARSGERARAQAIDVGFAPLEVAVAR